MKTAVVVHVFHAGFWDELAACVKNVGPCSLFVTYADEASVAAARRDFPDATFVRCENRGYDVWPFLKVVRDFRLDASDVVVKLHTKRDLAESFVCNHADLAGARWRELLLGFVGSRRAWSRAVRVLMRDGVGQVADRRLVFSAGTNPRERAAFDAAVAFVADLTGRAVPDGRYVAGTMFAVRGNVLAPLANHPFEAAMFPEPQANSGTFAHVMERVLGLVVAAAGLRVEGWNGSVAWRERYYAKTLFGRLCRAVFVRKIRDRDTVTKILGVPLARTPRLPLPPPKSGRILLVSHELTVTGAPNSLLRQAKYFRAAGYEVDVWTLKGGDLEARYREAGFRPVPVPDDARAIWTRYAEASVTYDLVVCNTTRAYRAVDAFRRTSLRVAWFIRETLLLDEDYWLNPDFAAIFSSFGNLYTVSDYAADVVRRYNPHVRVIRNSVADVFRGFAPPSSDVRFGFIGSIIPAKGIDVLIAAFREVRRKYPAATLTIAGGSSRDDFARMRAETASDVAIRWLGEVQAAGKQAFFDGIDVLCVPSLDEPSGLTVIEGAMQGKAIVTTDRTGANYLVNEANGRIVKAGDVASLSAAMQELAALDAASLAAFQRQARESYLALGTNEVERAAVLRMVDECRPEPPVRAPLRDASETPWFHAVHYRDGRCRWYFRNLRLLTFRGRGIVRR